jgi:hypothetical protein
MIHHKLEVISNKTKLAELKYGIKEILYLREVKVVDAVVLTKLVPVKIRH